MKIQPSARSLADALRSGMPSEDRREGRLIGHKLGGMPALADSTGRSARNLFAVRTWQVQALARTWNIAGAGHHEHAAPACASHREGARGHPLVGRAPPRSSQTRRRPRTGTGRQAPGTRGGRRVPRRARAVVAASAEARPTARGSCPTPRQNQLACEQRVDRGRRRPRSTRAARRRRKQHGGREGDHCRGRARVPGQRRLLGSIVRGARAGRRTRLSPSGENRDRRGPRALPRMTSGARHPDRVRRGSSAAPDFVGSSRRKGGPGGRPSSGSGQARPGLEAPGSRVTGIPEKRRQALKVRGAWRPADTPTRRLRIEPAKRGWPRTTGGSTSTVLLAPTRQRRSRQLVGDPHRGDMIDSELARS